MTGVWMNVDRPPINTDPFEHWLGEVGGQIPDGKAWVPHVYQFGIDDSGLDAARRFLDFLLRMFSDDLIIHPHDVANFGVNLFLHGRAELIVFFLQDSNGGTPQEGEFLERLKNNPPDNSLREMGRYVGAAISAPFADPVVVLDNSEIESLLSTVMTLINSALQRRGVETSGQHAVQIDLFKPPPPIITGIIDHAIGFANERFGVGKRQSRISNIWVQQGRDERIGRPPLHPLGVMLDKERIEDLLERLAIGDLPDETVLYREAGVVDLASPIRGARPIERSRSHGTMMLDIAAGYEPSNRVEDHPIYAVQLPAELVQRTNGYLHEPYVKTAMNWIWWRVLKTYGLDGIDRLVVNYSFGDYSGRHDGQDKLDADFEWRIRKRQVGMITVPAGNGFLSEVHARFAADQVNEENLPSDVDLMVQPDDKEATFVQVWLDHDYTDIGLQLNVTSPDGASTTARLRKPGETQDLIVGGKAVARIYYQTDLPSHPIYAGTPTPRTRLTLAIRPTASDDPTTPIAPAGLWELNLSTQPGHEITGTANLWVERGDTIEGFPPRGRQAYLDHHNHVEYLTSGRLNEVDDDDCPIKRLGTIGGNANASSTLVSAGYREINELRMAYYSAARGPGSGPQPTIAIPTELSAARPNIFAAGTFSGTNRATFGTSVAAAHAARALADIMRDKGNLAKQALYDLISTAAKPRPPAANASKDIETFEPERIGNGLVEGRFKSPRERVSQGF